MNERPDAENYVFVVAVDVRGPECVGAASSGRFHKIGDLDHRRRIVG